MTEQRKIRRKVKQKKPRSDKRQRQERRFVGKASQASMLLVGVGMLGSLVLGAGVFGQWVKDPAISYAQYLVAIGAVGLGVALWFGETSPLAVRVGDAGVGVEKGSDVARLAWCDIERIFVEKGKLWVSSDELTLAIPLAGQPQAVVWTLSEAVRRLPDIVDVKRSTLDRLPKPNEEESEKLRVEGVQVAGRRCAASDKLISFERDARVCPNCGQVYHRDQVPKSCVTCEAPLAKRAMAV